MKKNISVSICCLAYNHEKYISQALDGFLMQKTSFPVEIIVHDDSSTDSTRLIIESYVKKYPSKIKPIFQKKNLYQQGIKALPTVMFPIAKGKYIAICEGDDYWTDPYKLAKQYKAMEENKKASLCVHAALIANDTKLTDKVIRAANMTTTLKQDKLFHIASSFKSSTATLFFRRDMITNLPDWFYAAPNDDIPLKMLLASKGLTLYLDDIMAVRRTGVQGSWNDRIRNQKFKINHTKKTIEMLASFDKYTNYKYHTEVISRVLLHSFQLPEYNSLQKRMKLLKKHTTELYAMKPFSFMKIITTFIFPTTVQIINSIKRS